MTTDHVVVRPYFQDDAVTIIHGDSREVLPTLDRAAWCGISTLNPEGLRTRHLVAGTQHPLVVAPNLAEKKIEKGC